MKTLDEATETAQRTPSDFIARYQPTMEEVSINPKILMLAGELTEEEGRFFATVRAIAIGICIGIEMESRRE